MGTNTSKDKFTKSILNPSYKSLKRLKQRHAFPAEKVLANTISTASRSMTMPGIMYYLLELVLKHIFRNIMHNFYS